MPKKGEKKAPAQAGPATVTAAPEYEQAMDNGAKVIILHPGSAFLRLGKQLDPFPRSIPHVIAIRRTDTANDEDRVPDDVIGISREVSEDESSKQDEVYQSVHQLVKSLRTNAGARRQQVPASQLISTNEACPGMVLREDSVAWTDVSARPAFVIGDEALHVQPSSPYDLHWPMRFSDFNVNSDSGYPAQYTLESIFNDLEKLWGSAIEQYLEIPPEEFRDYSVVVLIADIFEHRFVKELISLIIIRMGFEAVIVHQESVCATYGAGLSSSCVVDIGDQTISVSCIDEGLSLQNTRLRADYGGRDITRCFSWILEKIKFPYKKINPHGRLDGILLTQLKESLCHMDPDIHGLVSHEFEVHQPGKQIKMFTLKCADEGFKAALGLFYPSMMGLAPYQTIHFSPATPHDPEDLFADSYFADVQSQLQPAAKVPTKPKPAGGASGNLSTPGGAAGSGNDIANSPRMSPSPAPSTAGNSVGGGNNSAMSSAAVPQSDASLRACIAKIRAEEQLADNELIGLDNLILASIESCHSDELKRRMLQSILLVGGSSMVAGMANTLRARLQIKLPYVIPRMPNTQVDVIANPKDQDARFICWKGGAVLSFLDNTQELWIRAHEWLRFGPQLLRERAPFVWS
ncbi:actin-related protein 8-like [Sycon ciliatum]|uniref:actin-related protein 8-like n=1 Tax=Sycon ciliatum TaxID=27933 RepID=UPI0031F6624F|eukprot:scpid10689/ scgid25950/ Actin-related protein 8